MLDSSGSASPPLLLTTRVSQALGSVRSGGVDERLVANRANWDDRTDLHLRSRFYDGEGWLGDCPGPRARELEALGDVAGLRLLHLQCHFGLDTLAWARAGARVTGLDFSEPAIDAARDLAARAGLDRQSEFVCADVHDAVAALGGATFDVVYVSLGALCWIPSVDRWAEQIGQLVTPGGCFYLHDAHPVAWALADDDVRFEHAYFEEAEAFTTEVAESYTDGDRPLRSQRIYEWNHSLGEIVTALTRHRLTLQWLVEHDWTVWQRFAWLVEEEPGHWVCPAGMPRVPLSFSLLASRPAIPTDVHPTVG